MNGSQDQMLPEAKTAPLFTILSLIVCGLWLFTIGFWSAIPFALVFSFIKRHAVVVGMRNTDLYPYDIDHLRLELRHLTSKLWIITSLQYAVWLLFWFTLRKG